MPFKRAGWLQPASSSLARRSPRFQCPLSGLVGCNAQRPRPLPSSTPFQCPLSGLVGCNRVSVEQRDHGRRFQCPLSGLVGCNIPDRGLLFVESVSMPFKRAGWLQRDEIRRLARELAVSMPFKRAGWLQPVHEHHESHQIGFNAL